MTEKNLGCLNLVLRGIVLLLLVGHGILNLSYKQAIINQYNSLGFSDAYLIARYVGIVEIAGAALIFIAPLRPLVFFFFIWKMGTELFYPHWELFEWIERGGSYGCLLALWFTLTQKKSDFNFFNRFRKLRMS